MTDSKHPVCSTRYAAIVLKAFQETIGPEKFLDIANSAGWDVKAGSTGFSFQEIRRWLEQEYTQPTVDGIFVRAGQAAYCDFLKEYATETGFSELEFRLLPGRKRILTGLQTLAQILNTECGAQVAISEEKGHWTWCDMHCPECRPETPDGCGCYFVTGLLQEFLSWVSGGRVYQFDQTANQVPGAKSCKIVINQRPLD